MLDKLPPIQHPVGSRPEPRPWRILTLCRGCRFLTQRPGRCWFAGHHRGDGWSRGATPLIATSGVWLAPRL